MSRATILASLLTLSVALTGCGGGSGSATTTAAPGGATTGKAPATTGAPASTQPAGPAKKKADAVKLPASVAGYTGKVTAEPLIQSALYQKAGDPAAIINVTVQPVPHAEQVIAGLKNTTKTKYGTCGELAGAGSLGCMIALDGGLLSVTGSGKQSAAELGAFTDAVYEAS